MGGPWRKRHGGYVLSTAVIALAALLDGCAGHVDQIHVRSPLDQATISLDAYVADQAAALKATPAAEAAAARSLLTVYSVHSAPVEDGGTFVAVAAFFYSATGHPVHVLSYADGKWSVVAVLGPDLAAPVQPLGDADLLALIPGPVSVADVTGDDRPDFLILLNAASVVPGVIVSQDGGTWRYVPNSGPDPTSDVIASSPQFVDGKLISNYDNCVPNCASGHNYQIVWTYEPSSGDFWAPNPSGLVSPPGAANSG